MLKLSILSSVERFSKEFERCCRKYKSLAFATAWCGNPKLVLPYEHLKSLPGRLSATIGRSFDRTHPDALDLLLKLGFDVRVFRHGADLFHPKVYLFSSRRQVAVFVGSSNLTYTGFYCNKEINVLLEGVPDGAEMDQIQNLEKTLGEWHSKPYSFVPDSRWMENYRKAYVKARKTEIKYRIASDSQYENSIASASWLRNADWQVYYGKVKEGLEQHNRNTFEYLAVLAAARDRLILPWNVAYFDDPEARGLIRGDNPYGWLGHVGASGRFGHLLKEGTLKQKQTIVDVINATGPLDAPLNWHDVLHLLKRLVSLGPTMKVWSRLLCLVRPDLYCTVASISVRKNLSETLGIPQSRFEHPDGYVELLKLIHASPWFQSPVPRRRDEVEVWQGRGAFMDAIFYSRVS